MSDEQSTTTPVEVAAPVEAPEAKSGFLSTATGYGTVGVKRGKPFVEVKAGRIEVQATKFRA